MTIHLNKVMVTGRPTHDLTLGKTKKDVPVVDLQIAVDDSYWDPVLEREVEKTQFLALRLYGKRAEALVHLNPKGRLLYFEGRNIRDEWTDETTTEKRTRQLIQAEDWQFDGVRPVQTNADAA